MDEHERRGVTSYIYYFLIAILSVIMATFLPMLGSAAGLTWEMPDTAAGWTVWSVSKLSTALFNVLIFHCFIQQGKVNIKTHENYIKAITILYDVNNSLIKQPRSPEKYYADTYGKKGVTVFLTTLCGFIGLSQAILTFDVKLFIAQAITMIIGLVFGVMSMKNAENYWTVEYLDYAVKQKEKKEHKDV